MTQEEFDDALAEIVEDMSLAYDPSEEHDYFVEDRWAW